MKASKLVPLLFIFVTVEVFSALTSQRETTIEDINGFLSDLDARTEIIPSDSFQLYSERLWIDDEMTKIRSLEATYRKRIKEPIRGFGDLLQSWEKFKLSINKLDESDMEEFNKIMQKNFEDLTRAVNYIVFRNNIDNISNQFEINDAWEEAPLDQIVTYDNNTGRFIIKEATQSNYGQILNFLKGDFSSRFDGLIASLENKSKEEEVKINQIINKLDNAESKLISYRDELKGVILKDETKSSLKSNLYLMILVIGGLSIGAIALVRWFPESVMLEWVESGQVIQFVTVMILLSVIMALGLAGLLTENTLGTLLGGIGGYVLSQGVGRSAARAALKEQKNINSQNE